jgi:glutathione S-transferase
MRHHKRTLEFLSRNYHPFTHFTEEMLEQAANGLRIFEVRAGENLSLQACSTEDFIFVTEGSANIRFEDNLEITVASSAKHPVSFSMKQSPVHISSDVSATICHADSALVNDFISLQEISNSADVDNKAGFMERLMFLKSTNVFRLLPLNVVEEAAHRCEEVAVEKDTDVIKQDMKADNFYIILQGEAEVWREELDDDEPQMVALLGVGDAFGEEALITGGARNATVKMTNDARLLQLAKSDFEKLVSAPALRSVTPEVAKAMLGEGAEILDVRFEEEYEESFIPGSVLMPLPELRSHIPDLDEEKEYLILCAAGIRAAAATLLLRQQNIKARFIEGGIKHWPYETSKNLDLELILFDFCPFAQRAAISLRQNDIPHTLTYLDPDKLPEWFEEVSPFGNVPILRVDGKTTIFESSVINELVAMVSASQMLPADPVERSVCRSWIEFGSTLLSQVTGMLSAHNEEEFSVKHADFQLNLQRLEDQLEGRGPYFSGDDFSLVDSTYAPLFMRMHYLNQYLPICGEGEYPRVMAWADKLLQLDSVKQSVPKDFAEIYSAFIKRRGENGFVDRQCQVAA